MQHRAAVIATAIYLAVIAYLPLYLASQTCRGDLGHGSGLVALARNWLSCRLRADHLEIGSYGSWLGGTVLIPAVYWAYRIFKQQAEATEQQRRAVFLATIRQQHEQFDYLAQRIIDVMKEEFEPYTLPVIAERKHPVETANIILKNLISQRNLEVKAALRRTAFAEEYIAEARTFIDSLRRFDSPAHSGGAWRDLLSTLEKLVPTAP